MHQAEIISFPRMASPERLTWNALLEMTHALLEQARAGDWSGALALQQARRPLLEQYFRDHPEQIDRSALANGIRVMLELDAEVARMAAAQRETLHEEEASVRRAGQVAGAYLRHGI